jgi:hypothetical protein
VLFVQRIEIIVADMDRTMEFYTERLNYNSRTATAMSGHKSTDQD